MSLLNTAPVPAAVAVHVGDVHAREGLVHPVRSLEYGLSEIPVAAVVVERRLLAAAVRHEQIESAVPVEVGQGAADESA